MRKHSFIAEHILVERGAFTAKGLLFEVHSQVSGVDKICQEAWDAVQANIEYGHCEVNFSAPWIAQGTFEFVERKNGENSQFVPGSFDDKGNLQNILIKVSCPLDKGTFCNNLGHELTHSYDYWSRNQENRVQGQPGYTKNFDMLKKAAQNKDNLCVNLGMLLYRLSRIERLANFGAIRTELVALGPKSGNWGNLADCEKAYTNLKFAKELEECWEALSDLEQVTDPQVQETILNYYESVRGRAVPVRNKNQRNNIQIRYKKMLAKLRILISKTESSFKRTVAKVCVDLNTEQFQVKEYK